VHTQSLLAGYKMVMSSIHCCNMARLKWPLDMSRIEFSTADFQNQLPRMGHYLASANFDHGNSSLAQACTGVLCRLILKADTTVVVMEGKVANLFNPTYNTVRLCLDLV
jgi:hypothetical protein